MADTTIQTLTDGPLCVKGFFDLMDGTVNHFSLGGRKEVYLCRCGQSTNKPFCSGMHQKCGFKANDKARALPPA